MECNLEAVLRDVRSYLAEHRDELVESYCVHEGGVPTRDTMDPSEAAEVERVEALIGELDAHLGIKPLVPAP